MGFFQSSSVILYSLLITIFSALIFCLWKRRNVPGALLILLSVVTVYFLVEAISLSGIELPGELSWYELKGAALAILAVAVTVGISVHISEQVRAERELNRKLEELSAQDHLRAESARHRRMEELLAISRVNSEINSKLDRQQVFGSIVRHAVDVSGCDASGLYLYRPDGRFYLEAAYGVEESFIQQVNSVGVPLEGSAVGRAAQERQPVQVVDAAEDTWYAVKDLAGSEGIRAILALPMLTLKEKILGGIVLWRRSPYRFSQEEVLFLQVLAQQSLYAIENARLFEQERRRAHQLEALNAIIAAAAAATDFDELLHLSLERIQHALNVDGACIRIGENQAAAEFPLELLAEFETTLAGPERPDRFLVEDWQTEQENEHLRPLARASLSAGFRSTADILIRGTGSYSGEIWLASIRPHAWSDDEVSLIETVAKQIGASSDRLRLLEETRGRLREVTLLSRVISLTASAEDLTGAMHQICAEVARFFGVGQAGFALLNPSSTSAEVVAEYREGSRSAEPSGLGIQIPVEGNPSMGYILKHKVPLAIADAQKDSLLEPIHDVMRRRDVASILLVPILRGDQVAGTLGIDSAQRREFSQMDLNLMQDIANQVGQALERLDLLARLQAQARQIEQMMETVPDGVLLLDVDRHIVLANPAAREYLALLTGVASVDTPLMNLAGYSIEALLDTSPDTPWVEIESAGDVRRVFEVAARPLQSKEQTTGWVLVLRDVTQERETQRHIQMQDRLATVGQLAAGIAHDFNNIMAAIVVYTDLLAMDPSLAPSSRERLVIIQQQVQRATSLIRQILDFSRRSIMEQSSLDLLPFVKELDKLLGRVLPENIRLELTYQPGSYMVKADPTRLQQVFMNLALNARDAMPQGGTLHFELERFQIRPSEDPPMPDLCPGSWIKIQVKDSGLGIHPEVKPHIFDPFFTTKPVGQGNGLGLAQVYGIIKQHGGSIDVESFPGRGTTFILYLPSLDPSPLHLVEVQAPENWRGKGETILIAEDDRSTRDAIKALLESHNYRTLTASTGLEALRIFENRRADVKLVISDVVMPEMGGMALYHHLHSRYGPVKMLFITGHPLDAENQLLLEEGDVTWMQKPFGVQDLLRAVQPLLETGSHAN